MRSIAILVLLTLTFSNSSRAQTRAASKPDPDRLGMTCGQILQMTSTGWVSHFNDQVSEKAGHEKKITPEATVRALAVFGQCYDARTNRLAAFLEAKSSGPHASTRKSFRDFQQVLEEFMAKALAATDPPADGEKKAYAALYEKEFRHAFYENYVEHISHEDIVSAAPEEAGDLGKAKNHFGELLAALPEDKLREVHKAFANVLNQLAFGKDMRLQVYQYAIFCLEPPLATPFSPPPF